MKLREFVEQLRQFDQDCDVEFYTLGAELSLGPVYDDADPDHVVRPKPQPTKVFIELDEI